MPSHQQWESQDVYVRARCVRSSAKSSFAKYEAYDDKEEGALKQVDEDGRFRVDDENKRYYDNNNKRLRKRKKK